MKNFKTNSELIQYLSEERNINFDVNILEYSKEFRFASFYSPYKDLLFVHKPRKVRIYPSAIKISDFINFTNLDLYFSLYLNPAIGNLERRLKTFLSDVVCNSMKEKGDIQCCDYNFIDVLKNGTESPLSCFLPLMYEYDSKGKLTLLNLDSDIYKYRENTICKIKQMSEKSENAKLNYYTKAYLEKNNCLPFWVLIGSLSFGDLSIMFNMLCIEHRKKFLSTVFSDNKRVINESFAVSFSKQLNALTTIRNIVHHHEPLIPFLIKKYADGRSFTDLYLNSFKNLISIYKESKFLKFSQEKPYINFVIYGENKDYINTLEKFYKLF